MKYQIGKIKVDTISVSEILQKVEDYLSLGVGGSVFTPNVDHVIEAENNHRFAMAYSNASICLPDGIPIVLASRLSKTPIKRRIAGSDFIYSLLSLCARRNYRVFFLGSKPETIVKAIERLYKMMPGLQIVGHSSPDLSIEVASEEVSSVLNDSTIRNARPDIVIVAFGAPKQELFIDKAMSLGRLGNTVFFGLGASIDFIAGDFKRAPKWMQKSGLEWAFRLYQEPKRLARRYFRDLKFPFIVIKTIFASK